MKRCEDSGLWVPGKGGSTSTGVEEEEEDNFDGDNVSDDGEPEGEVGEDDATAQL